MSCKPPNLPVEGLSDEWWTPKYIFDKIGLQFDLDPCMPENKLPWIPVRNSYDYVDDGLSKAWAGIVWLNPPYGRETIKWMKRLAEHGNGIALVPVRSDTRWWHETVIKSDAVCFIKGRIQFIAGNGQPAPSNSGAPSCLIAYGKECAEAIKNSGLGMVLYI
jgi:hypothetical protein